MMATRKHVNKTESVELFLTAWELMLLPSVLILGAWGQAMQMMWSFGARHPHHIDHDNHDQLVVPDPIEDEGEHALFA